MSVQRVSISLDDSVLAAAREAAKRRDWKWGTGVIDLAAGGGTPNTGSSFGFGVHALSLEGAGTAAKGSWAVAAP